MMGSILDTTFGVGFLLHPGIASIWHDVFRSTFVFLSEATRLHQYI